jgi:hypothetical protein
VTTIFFGASDSPRLRIRLGGVRFLHAHGQLVIRRQELRRQPPEM